MTLDGIKNWEFTIEPVRGHALLGLVRDLNDEVPIGILPSGIRVLQVDPPHVCMLDIQAPCDTKGDGALMFDLASLLQMLRAASVIGRDIKFANDPDKQRLNKYHIAYTPSGGQVGTYSSGRLEAERIERAVKTLNVTLPYKAQLRFKQVVAWLTPYAKSDQPTGCRYEHVIIRPSAAGLVFELNDKHSSRDVLTVDQPELFSLEPRKDTRGSNFSLDMLMSFLVKMPQDDLVMYEFGDDQPLRISFEWQRSKIMYMQAPRIEGMDKDEEE